MIVQDDTGLVAGANAYITQDFLISYWLDRGVDLTSKDGDLLDAKIVVATTYLDTRFRYRGRKQNARDQATQWPRVSCYDKDRQYVNGVPQEVLWATAEYAKRALDTELAPDPEYSSTGGVIQSKTEKVGPLEESVTYATGAAVFSMPRYPQADRILLMQGLTESGGDVRRA